MPVLNIYKKITEFEDDMIIKLTIDGKLVEIACDKSFFMEKIAINSEINDTMNLEMKILTVFSCIKPDRVGVFTCYVRRKYTHEWEKYFTFSNVDFK